jgi:hypothetical protein
MLTKLSNREKHSYGRAIDQKLASAGVDDKILMKVVKVLKIHNPAFKPGADGVPTADSKNNPEFFQVPRYQAVNLRRNITKRLLRTNDRKAIETFLKSDLSALKETSDAIKEEVSVVKSVKT